MLCDENSAACGGSLGLWGGEAICFVENSVDSRRDFTLSSLPECAPPPSAPPPEDPCTVACAVEDPDGDDDGGIIGIVGIVVGVLALVVLSVLLFLWLTGAACFNKADGRHPTGKPGAHVAVGVALGIASPREEGGATSRQPSRNPPIGPRSRRSSLRCR